MKRFILAVAAIAAVCAHGAPDDSAVANRKWVRQYVSSITGELPPPTSITTNAASGEVRYEYDIDGAEIGISDATAIAFTFSYPTNPALAVVESTIGGLPKGEIYASDGLAFLSTNALMPSISCSVSNVYTTATNAFGATSVTTNSLITLSATDTQGRAYTSAANAGLLYLFDATNTAKYAVLIPTYVSDDGRAAALHSAAAPPRRWRILSMLIPSAYAEEGEWLAHSWYESDVVNAVNAIQMPTLSAVEWRDTAGRWHEFDLSTANVTAQMRFTDFSIDDFRNVENPLSQAKFLDPKTWFGDVKSLEDGSGNGITLARLQGLDMWRDLMKRLYQNYLNIIEYMKTKYRHKCQFDENCNCIWKDETDERLRCPFKNPQHDMNWIDSSGNILDNEADHSCYVCVRCAKYVPIHKIHEDHCGCACGFYTAEKNNVPDMMHWIDDGECWCECGKKHLGAEELCEGICKHCFKKIDDSGDTPEASEHTPFTPGELPDGVSSPDRCGCLCGYVAQSTDIEKFHNIPFDWGNTVTGQGKSSSCWCFCGRRHKKTSADKVYDFGIHVEQRCPNFCAVCNGVNASGLDVGAFDAGLVNGHHNPSAHDPSDHSCGCACGAISSANGNLSLVAGISKFHKFTEDTCTCDCTLYVRDMNHVWGQWSQSGVEPGFILYERECTLCGKKDPKKEPCGHVWGNWIRISDFPGGTLFRKTCTVCGATDDMLVNYADSQSCNTNLNLHIPLDDSCGCKCGHYGTRVAEEKDFHKWDATDTEGGIANCHCMCGAKHEWRDGCDCPNVCAFCKELRKDGSRAKESDHKPATRTKRRCGCECGYYGVSSDHVANRHIATDPALHIQSKENNSSSPSSPAYCQCYGANGTGGMYHWCYPRNSSTSCGRICQYVRTGETLGHRASTKNPTEEVEYVAKPEDHTGNRTDHMRGNDTSACGCKCGLCNSSNHSDWARNRELHQYYALADDKCHCDCSEKVLCGDTVVDGERHTFPISTSGNNYVCTCTCGSKHRLISGCWVDKGKCGKLCTICGKLIKSDGRRVSNISSQHDYDAAKCKCDCGDHVNPDGHWYAADSCICQCEEEPLDHIATSTSVNVSHTTCTRCGAVFDCNRLTVTCARCGVALGDSEYVYVGQHASWCGRPNNPKPGCSRCGCHCTGKCSGHYCSACCTRKPTPRPKRPTPEDPEDVPDPCNHNNTGRREVTASDSWTCDICGHTLSSTTRSYYCLKCGAFVSSTTSSSGTHGTHPGGGGEDSGEPPEGCPHCGATDGNHSHDCPNYTPTGSGGSGGSGDINDI